MLSVTLPELDKVILKLHHPLKLLHRSDPQRRTLLCHLAVLQSQRRGLSNQKSDFDKAITHLTEAVLLSSTQAFVHALFLLAIFLQSRFEFYQQPDDLKSSIKYYRFLRINFPSLEPFDIPQSNGDLSLDLSSNLFRALAFNLVLTPCEIVQNLEEMAALIPEFITADLLTYRQGLTIEVFCLFVFFLGTKMIRREDTQRAFNRLIQALREAALLNLASWISYALVICLNVRFLTTHVMNDYEEAIAIAYRIVSTCSPENNLTVMERNTISLISGMLVYRANLSPTPESLEDAIHRLRTFVSYPLNDEDRTHLTLLLGALTHKRFQYFGFTENSGESPDPNSYIHLEPYLSQREDATRSQIQEKMDCLMDFAISIANGETTDVEEAVKASRNLLPLQQSSDQWSSPSNLTSAFAGILLHAYQRTERLDYLNEAITTYRNLRKLPAAPKLSHFDVGTKLHHSLRARFKLLHRLQDFKELMQLSSELANDGSGEVFTRFEISCFWAPHSQVNRHSSAFIAYETAMSLLQETLIFCPTLQNQHRRLLLTKDGWRLPSDYASYQLGNDQVKQAIETLERGRTLIWSEMRGLRSSTDQLRAANPAIADKFLDINRRLETVTMYIAQSDDEEIGRNETGTRHHEYSIGHLVFTQQTLLGERNTVISHIQSLPDLEDFLKPLSFDVLNSAAACGPVIIINLAHPELPSFVILLLKDSPPSIISTPSGFYDRANQLENELLRVRKEKGLDSKDYDDTLASVLSSLFELVGKPVIERLRELKVPEKSRVWWCPTGAFCSLPLHAMGPIPSDDGDDLYFDLYIPSYIHKERYFTDLYISSYTPSLSALIESRKRRTLSDASDKLKPSILLVAQPNTLPGALDEITVIQNTKTPVTVLASAMATPETVIKGLREHNFAHFVCHGLLETGKPFDASLELHKTNLTLLEIVRSQLPAAEFAFLSACHTADLTEDSVAQEGLHLAAAMQYCGFHSVIGTMWAMADTDGADLSKHFYKAIFADKADQNGVPYHERSARALQTAVKKLRNKRGVTLERWVNFVHYGA